MRATASLAAAVLAVLLLATAPASAQWDPSATADLGAGYGQLALSQSILSNTRDGGSGGGSTKPKKKPKQPKQATARQLRALRFAPDPAVTQADNARLAEVLLASCPPERAGCPVDHAAIIAKYLPTGAFLDSFGGTVEDVLDGSRRNVADAVAGFLVLVWLTQRAEPGREADLTAAETAGAQRFLRDTRTALARNRRIRRLADAEQQQLAETLANVAQHGINLQYTYFALGQPALGDEVSGYLRDVAQDWLSIDVADLRLTRRGFVRR